MRLIIALLTVAAVGLTAFIGCGCPGTVYRVSSDVAYSPSRSAAAAPTPGLAAPPAITPPADSRVIAAQAGAAVKAGWADDNAQYNYYLGYLDRFAGTNALRFDAGGRIVFTVLDSQRRPMPNAQLSVRTAKGQQIATRTTYADGRAIFFPHEMSRLKDRTLVAEARRDGQVVRCEFDPAGPSSIELRFQHARPAVERVPLDIAFIIDTTGSMGDEIDKLKKTLGAIQFQVSQMTPAPDVRFGMVVYRDHGDAYVTRLTPFTGDGAAFAKRLAAVSADGGGDGPEDVQEALRVAACDLKWRP
ncbi:MAG: VWA domain-containing protein, partial [Phycisphaerae bacterium]|nr:VWA domain-containing protein [Phycisphaerae bacterium]